VSLLKVQDLRLSGVAAEESGFWDVMLCQVHGSRHSEGTQYLHPQGSGSPRKTSILLSLTHHDPSKRQEIPSDLTRHTGNLKSANVIRMHPVSQWHPS
jgi:hypothetical protein